MTIFELSDMMQRQICWTYYPGQEGRISATIQGAEVKEGGCLIGVYADGETPEDALSNYVNRIKGKVLVIDACKECRHEFGVPETLTADTHNIDKARTFGEW